MDRLLVFVSCITPSLFILGYGIAKCRSSWTNEALWTAFLLGAVGGIVAIAIELGLMYVLHLSISLSSFTDAIVEAAVIAAIPEETLKFMILVGVAERHVDARRLQDVLVLALGVSLGFATLENLFYLATASEWHFIAMARAITAIPGHGIFGLAMGALLIAARLRPRRFALLIAWVVPVLLHAAYDFPLLALRSSPGRWWLLIVWMVVLVLSAATAIILCNRTLPAAAEADRVSGRDLRSPAVSTPLIAGAAVLIAIGPSTAVAMLLLKDIRYFWMGAAFSILPVALAIDLFCVGIARRRLRSASE
jgi:RsiW-degrading membrane proteinase PrsW (M82 family)